MIPHLLRCQGFAVVHYGFTLSALNLEYPRLPFNQGLTIERKPMIPYLLRCQGFAVVHYGFTLSALNLEHPRLSFNQAFNQGLT
jgi:hypothetical protein